MQAPARAFGPTYLARGFELITTKGLRRFVLLPLLANIIIFGFGLSWLFSELETVMVDIMSWLPSYFQWLEYVLWPLFVIGLLLTVMLLFGTLTNLIAAPFNGLLAEKVEAMLTGDNAVDNGVAGMIKDIPRTLGRELKKLAYYLPRLLVFGLLFFLLPVIGQLLWLAFSGWMMAIQYLDYPFDNHRIAFSHMRGSLAGKRGTTWSFGLVVAVLGSIPFINLFIMPAAVCGATALWVDHYRTAYLDTANSINTKRN